MAICGAFFFSKLISYPFVHLLPLTQSPSQSLNFMPMESVGTKMPSCSPSGRSAGSRNFAPFESDPPFENLSTDQRTSMCVVLHRTLNGPLPFVFGVQNSSCGDDFESHEEARSRIHSVGQALKLQNLARKIVGFGFQFQPGVGFQRHAQAVYEDLIGHVDAEGFVLLAVDRLLR